MNGGLIMQNKLVSISEGNYSTLLGMNGGCPESPDGKLIVYARKNEIVGPNRGKTEIWICDRDLNNHRKVFDVNAGNHNGPSASFIDNKRIVFRDSASDEEKSSMFYIYNIETNQVEIGPIIGKESHCAENNIFPFSTTKAHLNKNPKYPMIDEVAIYALNCDNGEVKKIMAMADMVDYVASQGYTTNEWSANVSHVQLNPSGTSVMMRVGIVEGALLVCFDIDTKKFSMIADKPVHQLWFDDDTYMAVYQYHDGQRWHMDKSRINRYSKTGEILEVLGGIGNHVDGSPDRNYFTGDSMYPDEIIKVFLYKKGDINPIAVLDEHSFFEAAWKAQVHSNPSFSRDGKRVYFNRPVSETKTTAVYVDISNIIEK
jgi:hypothetical protein